MHRRNLNLPPCRALAGPASRQRGVALVVALLLLLVITIVGLAAVRGTIMQQKMASNLFDRQVAFQSAEAAMRVATDRLVADKNDVARNCGTGGVICLADPFADASLVAGKIITVTSGTGDGEFNAGTLAAGQPQYVVEQLDRLPDPESGTGCQDSANSSQYGDSSCGTSDAEYYRITARSADPATAGDRAVVTLQSMVKKRLGS